MKTALTDTISEIVQYDYAGGPVSKPIILTEYYSDTQSTWVELDNVESRSIELSNENKRYQSYSFLPPSRKLDLQLNNFEQIYSTGSGSPEASILKKNLLIRCWSGYREETGDPLGLYGSGIYGTSLYSTADSHKNDYLFQQGVFIIDDPKPTDTKVKITGRDYLRKALETEINLPTYNNENIANVMTDILDRCSIPYDTATWNVTSTTVSVNATLSEDLNDISGWKALDHIMDAINAGNDDWRFRFNQDGNPELKILPTDVEADWTSHYFYNIESISKGEDSQKQLQRVTAVNRSFVTSEERTLNSVSGTTSGTTLRISYGTLGYYKHSYDIKRNSKGVLVSTANIYRELTSTAFTYYDSAYNETSATNATAINNLSTNKAVYVRYVDNNDVISTESDRGNTYVEFSVNSGVSYDIDVLGCIKNTYNNNLELWSESGNSDNIKTNDGSTTKITNPFMDQTMLQSYADYLLGQNAEPEKRIELTQNPNPMLELNDNVMVFDLYTYTDDIYGLITIKEVWSNPGLKQKLVLKDRGFDLGDFIWDRGASNPRVWDKPREINNLLYDRGFVWDQDLDVNATGDPTDYNNTKEVVFRSV